MGQKERRQRREKRRAARGKRTTSAKPSRAAVKAPSFFAPRTVAHKPSSPELEAYEARLDAIVFRPPTERPSVLCHYTTYEGLTGILTDRGFHARHHYDTNDPLELRAPDELSIRVARELSGKYSGLTRTLLTYFAQKHPQNRLSEITDVFIASFTSERDEKLHWEKYGNAGAGICIVLKVKDEENPELQRMGIGTELMRVTYEPEEWRMNLRGTFEAVIQEFAGMTNTPRDEDFLRTIGQRALVALARLTGKAAMSSKIEDWQHEKEWRVGGMREAASDVPIVEPPGRSGRVILLPGRPLGRLLDIEELIIGGKQNPDSAMERIRTILVNAGYPSADASTPRISASRHSAADLNRD